jgi:hypothetical protein
MGVSASRHHFMRVYGLNRPNQAMKRIAAGVKMSFFMTKTSSLSSTSLSAAIRLSCSR